MKKFLLAIFVSTLLSACSLPLLCEEPCEEFSGEPLFAENFREFVTDYVFLQRDVLVMAADGDTVWARQYLVHLVKSTNHGESWTFAYEFENHIQGIHLDEYGNIFVSTSQDRWSSEGTAEVFKSADGGQSFRKVLSVGAGAPLNWNMASRGGVMFISEYGYKGGSGNNARRIYRSLDFGETWEVVFEPAPRHEWHNHKILITEGGVIYQSIGDGGNARIIRSADNGDTWQIAVRGFHPTSAVETDGYILWGLDSGLVPGVIRYCLQTGETGQSLALPPPFNGPAYDMAVANGIVYVGFMSYARHNFPSSIFYSRDSGYSWNLLGYIEKPSPENGIGLWHIIADEKFIYIDLQAPLYHNGEVDFFRGTMRFPLIY